MNEITDEMKEKISEFKEHFYAHTYDGHIINYLNGFIGVGIFKVSQDHLTKGINTIWLFEVGFNKDGSDIIEIANIEMALDEAENMRKALDICIEKLKR